MVIKNKAKLKEDLPTQEETTRDMEQTSTQKPTDTPRIQIFNKKGKLYMEKIE